MSHNSIDEAALEMIDECEDEQRLELAFQDGWHPGLPVPMPEEPIRKFSESALQVGHFKEDVPGYPSSISANRKRNAKAYFMVKRFDTNPPMTCFLWCDADGKPVNKRFIQMAEGLDMEHLKRDLIVMYNDHEMSLVVEYNEALKVAKDRLALRQCELGRVDYMLPADQGGDGREPCLCSETDTELN
ncbi:hypothetical protein H9Q69_003404 [Fusarium xylarioides]|uniref:Uncharacterized protein n=1 Tax=Fusarium xylarioides TaxID=221167 RepID=A0A9P7I591_9HYPO|nr:hypothetical protein H9Q70_001777 [Fusarium xylarioides]KAG5770007.1 hypothetical protein H9Q72_002915 [Fusarium xylarioides]KAG5783844.1 hypothetical protein H9Q73_002492 [Fusarium xylarioides]KAG5797544.1 hypothetical protein H9Q69_003404 [Fusarium xylarioides]KAG5811094.1 hypothetical protein H9Q71_005072 [Fusarium xylarioides]